MLSMRGRESRWRSRRRCESIISAVAGGTARVEQAFGCSEASNQNNKSRLRLLQAREEKLEELFEEARKRLTSLDEDKGKYESVLKGLILQVRVASLCLTWRIPDI